MNYVVVSYLAHVLETAGHRGPGTRASGCHVRQYTIQANQYASTSKATFLTVIVASISWRAIALVIEYQG
jgi:hypothetical protein